jgi:hypothetical protein
MVVLLRQMVRTVSWLMGWGAVPRSAAEPAAPALMAAPTNAMHRRALSRTASAAAVPARAHRRSACPVPHREIVDRPAIP